MTAKGLNMKTSTYSYKGGFHWHIQLRILFLCITVIHSWAGMPMNKNAFLDLPNGLHKFRFTV